MSLYDKLTIAIQALTAIFVWAMVFMVWKESRR